jgi:sugar phosphate isomerase/epimerase
MLLGLETFSYHLAFAYRKMDVFSFIQRAADLGLDGVQLNIEGDDFGHLGNDDPSFLKDVRDCIEQQGFYVELDTCGTDPDHLSKVLDVCSILGADRLRTYSSFGGDVNKELQKAKKDFPKVMDRCAELDIKISFENHEFESSHDVLDVISQVNSPYIGAHIDTGNSMMIWEDPLAATENMASVGVSTHFKDHLVIRVGDEVMIAGVPLGNGSIDLKECYEILVKQSPLKRINIEVCYGYLAPFRIPQQKGYGAELGKGCFSAAEPPYEPEIVAPYLLDAIKDGLSLDSYAWQELANSASARAERDRILEYQDKAVVDSVNFVKKIRDDQAG